MKKKKLLIAAAVPNSISRFLLPFGHYFRHQGWQVDAMANGISSCSDCIEAFDHVWDAELARSPFNLKNLLIAPSHIREVVIREQYDIVHVHMAVPAFVTRYALKDIRKYKTPKIIYTAHGFNFYKGESAWKNTIFLNLEKLAGMWTDYIVVINHEDQEAAHYHRLIDPERVRYMPGIGVDLNHYNPNSILESEKLSIYQELNLKPGVPLFLSIAEFIPRKRHKDILRAFVQIASFNAHLAFAGEGKNMEEIRQLATTLGVQDQVHFLGFRTDIPNLIQASVATILASDQEGLPRSIMESMCLGTPVIGTAIRGITDLLEGGCGLLINMGDVNGIAEAMRWILEHPQEAKTMGKRGQERIANTYELQNILKLHETLYAEAIAGSQVGLTEGKS